MSITLENTPKGLYIGGKWRASSDGAHFEVVDPATELRIAEVASASLKDAGMAIDAAAAALPGWAARAPRERGEILRRAFTVMMERLDDIARLIVLENGKSFKDARAEAGYAAEFFRWYSEEAVRGSGEIVTAPSGTNKILVLQQPVGVSLLITPWNFPAAMATRKIGPALAAGCTVLLKPASETPLTALAIAHVLEEAGVPPGVVNVIPCNRSSTVVAKVLHDSRVRKLSFTGSTEIGRILLAQAADCVVNCSMELGGNAPFLVFADADLGAAVEGAMIAKMRNGGEACTAANRFYVEASVADEFGERLAAAMSRLKVGPGLDDGIDVGPLVNEATRTKVAELVDDAVGRGGKVLTGGHRPDRKGYFYQPTVVLDAVSDSHLLHEEIFGPVAPIVRFTDLEQAIALANDTEYGLVSYVYTRDVGKGLRVAERLEAGMIGLNRGVVSDPAAPFGGVKQSGIGREGGHDGMLEFLEKKYVAVSW